MPVESAARVERGIEELKMMVSVFVTKLQGTSNGGKEPTHAPAELSGGSPRHSQPDYQLPTKCLRKEFPQFTGEDL